MRITKRQLRRIIKEEKAKILHETLADTQFMQGELERNISNLTGAWAEQMDGMFEEDPEAFAGRSTKEEWTQQVDAAQATLEMSIKEWVEKEMENVEVALHDGHFADSTMRPGTM
jgi:hypothetical protein